MYKQYTREHQTELGMMKIERTFKAQALQMYSLDSIVVSCAGLVAELPRSMWQTDRTIIEKMVAVFKPQLQTPKVEALKRIFG